MLPNASARVREVLRLDRSLLAPTTAVSCAIGYAIPLAIGLATGHLADGVAASAGALIVGFADIGGPYRVRAGMLLAATATAGAAALLGGLAGPSAAATVIVMSLWGFAAGLLVALGTRAAFVGMLSTWALLLAGDLDLHGAAVLHETCLMVAGGVVQLLVAVATWPFRPFAAERRTVADAYAALARYARSPNPETLQESAKDLQLAAETVGGSVCVPGTRSSLRTLVEQGEWIRLELAALARLGARELLGVAAIVLDAIAAGDEPSARLADLQVLASKIDDPALRPRALALVRGISAATQGTLTRVPRPVRASNSLEVLRAELGLRSSAFRHALRLGASLAVAGRSIGGSPWARATGCPSRCSSCSSRTTAPR